MKCEETHSVRDAEQNFEKESQQSGNGYCREHRLQVQQLWIECSTRIGDDIEPVGDSHTDLEPRHEEGEEEEALELEIPTVETNLKNLERRAQPVREDGGQAVHRNWCAVLSTVGVLRNIFNLNWLSKKKENGQSYQCCLSLLTVFP